MVTSSNCVSQCCCFDYGSGENSHTDTGNATMNAIEWGTACWFGGCTGSGPWVEADLENGMYLSNAGNNSPNRGYTGVHFPFVTAMEKNNGTSNFTLKYGNATSGGLTTAWSGPLPNGYSPMKTDSSILLGTGGDNSDNGTRRVLRGRGDRRLPVGRHRERGAGRPRRRRLRRHQHQRQRGDRHQPRQPDRRGGHRRSPTSRSRPPTRPPARR